MAKSARKPKGSPLRTRLLIGILLGTVSALWAVALGAFLMDGNWRLAANELGPRMGTVSYWTAYSSVRALGVVGAWLLPLIGGALCVRLVTGRRIPGTGNRSLVTLLAIAVLAASLAALPGGEPSPGRALFVGWLGGGLVQGLRSLFGGVGAFIILFGGLLGLLASLGVPVLAPVPRDAPRLTRFVGRLGVWARNGWEALREMFIPDDLEGDGRRRSPAESEDVVVVKSGPPAPAAMVSAPPEVDVLSIEPEPEVEPAIPEPEEEPPVVVLPPRGEPDAPAATPVEVIGEIQQASGEPYAPPPLDFLEADEDAEDDGEREELLENAKILEQSIRDFGVKGKVTQVQPGPVITRYEIEPAPGQKVAPIANLSDDLALAMRAKSIRIVAPIPGKAAVGIEVPNPKPRVVRLGSLLESPEYTQDSSPLNIALGRSISGEPVCVALDRMPHLLVAGATGAGKSVCINTIIASMVYRAGPEDVRFVMVDPKMLELTAYVGLPHLIPPVVSQPKDAVKILKWAVGEMEARYRTLAHVGVRSIVDYNKRQEREEAPKLPYLVVIIDELADLMLSNVRSEIEECIARLAQMARAVGIHLVLATQRPSVDVITGVIKANFPSRVAFQVPTRTDSRTILDSIGAERLLGKGDMLYLGVGMAAPMRVHGSFISTEETNDIIEWMKTRNPPPERDEEEAPAPLGEENDLFPRDREDDLFEEAARILVAHQQGSISLLQRRLKVGYARAARLVDMMEEAGIVGPFTGSKAREILIPTVEELEKKLGEARHTPLGGSPAP